MFLYNSKKKVVWYKTIHNSLCFLINTNTSWTFYLFQSSEYIYYNWKKSFRITV